MADAPLDSSLLLELLGELGAALEVDAGLTLVGASAGLLTRELKRTTLDCDVIQAEPPECWAGVLAAARAIAVRRGLPDDWLSNRVMKLDILPSGWRSRRIGVGKFDRLHVWCVGRLDLMAMKVHAGRMQDRDDVLSMCPTADELGFVRRYLNQLRVPSRRANLDQVQSALRFVDALGSQRE